MSQDQLAELSRFLYSPVTLLAYVAATGANLYALTARAAPAGRRDGGAQPGALAQRVGIALAVLAVVAHLSHEVVRGLAQQRLPLGNMFEFSSAMALTGAIAGLVYLLVIRRRPELLGFVMLAATLVVGSAMLAYSEPGPLQPILDTWWRSFHVSVIVMAAGILTVGFVFTALYLLRDTAERRLADARTAVTRGSTVGAAHVSDLESADDVTSVDERVAPDAPGETRGAAAAEDVDASAYRAALRAGISPWRLAIGTFLGASTVSWIYIATPTLDQATGLQRFLTINLTLVAAALLSRWFVGFLPPAATLDDLAYRTIALGFFAWTFGTIAGAMWAEQSWGRFWGWDPKETGAFLTWVAYAAYLHARATRGARGRAAGWIGLWSFAVLMFAYQGVNLVIVGLHSYADL